MAQRRMISLNIVDTDAFLDMPASTQNLYFHLNARGDDDGFVGNPKNIMRMVGASDDDMKLLIVKKFIIFFESGVCVIKHWLIHNLIRKDRYTETTYKKEKKTLGLNEFSAYTENISSKIKPIKRIEEPNYIKIRKEARKKSSLPDSFDYKIRQAFMGKDCSVCKKEMVSKPIEDMEYGDRKKHTPTIQHNIPLTKGGEHEISNISVICHSCNVRLGSTPSGDLNSKEVEYIWNTIGNQSATQVRLGKVRLGKDKENKSVSVSKKRKNKITKWDFTVAKKLSEKVKKNNPIYWDRRAPNGDKIEAKEFKYNLNKWANDIKLMRTVDKLHMYEILALISFTQNDNFWMGNIRSASKLRSQVDQLYLKHSLQIRAVKNKIINAVKNTTIT